LWVVDIIKPKDKDILLHIHISAAERNMFVAEHFLRSLVKKYGRYPVSTDGRGTWYHPQACKFLQIK
jgi:putative transposase